MVTKKTDNKNLYEGKEFFIRLLTEQVSKELVDRVCPFFEANGFSAFVAGQAATRHDEGFTTLLTVP